MTNYFYTEDPKWPQAAANDWKRVSAPDRGYRVNLAVLKGDLAYGQFARIRDKLSI